MPRAWLSLGSNIDRDANIRSAVRALYKVYGPLVVSRVYESEPVGFEGERFFNLVVGIETDSPVDEINARLRAIEASQGRVRGAEKFVPRTLDIDILTYGDTLERNGELVLPRDEITKYAFALRPLAEVAGDERHPTEKKTYRELWAEFDKAGQKLWPSEFQLDVHGFES